MKNLVGWAVKPSMFSSENKLKPKKNSWIVVDSTAFFRIIRSYIEQHFIAYLLALNDEVLQHDRYKLWCAMAILLRLMGLSRTYTP